MIDTTNNEGCSVQVKMTVAERERLRKLAQDSGLSMAEYVRLKIDGADQEGGIQVSLPDKDRAKLFALVKDTGLSVSEIVAAWVHEASQVRLFPGRLSAVAGLALVGYPLLDVLHSGVGFFG